VEAVSGVVLRKVPLVYDAVEQLATCSSKAAVKQQ
jgi:hypothetical protein